MEEKNMELEEKKSEGYEKKEIYQSPFGTVHQTFEVPPMESSKGPKDQWKATRAAYQQQHFKVKQKPSKYNDGSSLKKGW